PQRSCQTSQKTAPLLAHHQTPLLRQTLLGQNQPLPWHEDGAVQMVPLLELPDPLPRVSRVVGGRDRPEGVGRLDDVARRLPSAAGRSSDDAYYEGDSQEEDGQPREHVFVVYRTPVRLVKRSQGDEFRRDPRPPDAENDHRMGRRAPPFRRRARVE